MIHHEFYLMDFTGKKKFKVVKNETTLEIALRLAQKIKGDAMLNHNKPKDEEYFMSQYGVSRISACDYPMFKEVIVQAYGYENHPIRAFGYSRNKK